MRTGEVSVRRRPLAPRLLVAPAECYPGTLTKNGGGPSPDVSRVRGTIA